MPRVKLFDESEVLEKAMNLFWKQGYYATSIQDLVNNLGINRASLYDTYGGKKKLFESAFSRYQKSNSEAIVRYLEKYEDVREGLKKLFTMAIEQSISDKEHKGCMVVNTTIEFIPNENDFVVLIEANKKKYEGMFAEYLQKGVERGQISNQKNLKAIASLLFTFYNGLRVVTKVEFDSKLFLESVDALLVTLD